MSIQKEMKTVTSFSLVVETGINFIINKHIGIRIASFVNFNKNALTAGYRVNILLGLFKKRFFYKL